MMYMYSGTPGAGKSLNVARTVFLWLRHRKRVISSCNIDVRLCFLNFFSKLIFELTRGKVLIFDSDDERIKNFTYMNIYDFTPKYFIEYALKNHVKGVEKQTLIVFDECVSIFSPEKCVGNFWLEWQEFFQYHRHLGYEIILVPQSTELLARKVKHFAEFEVRHRAMKNANFFMAIVSLLLGGIFTTKTYWQGSANKKHIDKQWFRYSYILGKSYNSYCMFDEFQERYEREQAEALKPKPLTFRQKQAVQLCNLLNMRITELSKESGD